MANNVSSNLNVVTISIPGARGSTGLTGPTGSGFPFVGNASITGSLHVSGSGTISNIGRLDNYGEAYFTGSLKMDGLGIGTGIVGHNFTVGPGSESANFIGLPAGVSGSFSGSFAGDGSNLTGFNSASFASTAISASYAATASYAISASHEIIKEISSSHANTADLAGGLTGQPSISVTNITASGNISASGIYTGDGSGLTNIPASGITGLNLSRIASGSATASISPDKGFQINTDTTITGSLTVSGSTINNIGPFNQTGLAFLKAHSPEAVVTNANSFSLRTSGSQEHRLMVNAGGPAHQLITVKGHIVDGEATDQPELKIFEVGGDSGGGSTLIRLGDHENTFQTGSHVNYVAGTLNFGTSGKTNARIAGNLDPTSALGRLGFNGDNYSPTNNPWLSLWVSEITASSKITTTELSSSGNVTAMKIIGPTKAEGLLIENLRGVQITDGTATLVTNPATLTVQGTSGLGSGGNLYVSTDITASGNVSSSITSTASFGTYLGDGSQLSGITAGPFTQVGSTSTYQAQAKDLQITGSLVISGSFIPLGKATDDTNVLIGKSVATNITSTSGNNVVIGNEAGGGGGTFDNADGNVLIGYQAGNGVDGGDNNICIGYQAGYLMDANIDTIAIGHQTLRNIGQNYAVGIGAQAGRFQTNGSHTLIGAFAGYGVSGQSNGRYNTAIGYNSGRYLEDGYFNVIIGGEDAGRNVKDGYHNVIVGGEDAGYNLTDGTGNTILGSRAGKNIVTGDHNIIIGYSASFSGDVSNQLFIGSASLATISASLATGHVLLNSLAISSSTSTMPLSIQGSGSTVFDVIGSEGTLFSVDDDLNGMLFTTNDISGLPVLQASASGDVYIGKSPQSLYTTAVISATSASSTASVYALSTSSYDGAFFDYTVTSGSGALINARAGNIMTVWQSSSIVHTETTTTDIGSTAGIKFDVIISQSQAQLVTVTDSTSPNTWKVKTIVRSI